MGFYDLYHLWHKRKCQDEYWGSLINNYLAQGGLAKMVKQGEAYGDVGTLNGYRKASRVLDEKHNQAFCRDNSGIVPTIIAKPA